MPEKDHRLVPPIFVDKKGNMCCRFCNEVLGEARITPEDEAGLPAKIKIHLQLQHDRTIEAEFVE